MIDYIINNFDLEQIANSGQCFRMTNISDNTYKIVAMNKVLFVENLGGSNFRFYCNEDDFANIWYNYFDLDSDYQKYIDTIKNNKDNFLIKATNMANGVRILNQDPWETLITFIISQRKNIPAIKRSVELLSTKYGEKISDEDYSFPNAEKIASLSLNDLNNCSLGYRSRYILDTAQKVNSGIIDLEKMKSLNDTDLLNTLLSFTGVGVKVANCVSLFAYHRIEAFPIDVWISRILEKEYSNNFNKDLYKGFEGIVQQYMFYYAQNSDEYKKK